MCSESLEAHQHAIDGAMQRTRAELERVEALLISRRLRAAAGVEATATPDDATRPPVAPELRDPTAPIRSVRVYLVLPSGVAGAVGAAGFVEPVKDRGDDLRAPQPGGGLPHPG